MPRLVIARVAAQPYPRARELPCLLTRSQALNISLCKLRSFTCRALFPVIHWCSDFVTSRLTAHPRTRLSYCQALRQLTNLIDTLTTGPLSNYNIQSILSQQLFDICYIEPPCTFYSICSTFCDLSPTKRQYQFLCYLERHPLDCCLLRYNIGRQR